MINIDRKIFEKSELNLYLFFILCILYQEEYEFLNITKIKEELIKLEKLQFIKITGDILEEIELRKKTYNLFGENEINFDSFWDNFPINTPSGRSLRAGNKMWHGKLTNDYLKCKKKYLTKVKSKEEHETIINILEAKAISASIKDREYENGIEVYINQKKWERDIKFLQFNSEEALGGQAI